MTLEDLQEIRDDCKALVTRRAALSAGAAVVPLPGLDVGVDITILIRMLPAINRRFGLSIEQIDELDPETKKIVLVLASAVGSQLIGRVMTREVIFKAFEKFGIKLVSRSVLRFVPILGQIAGASLSFGAMKMLGNAHVDDCYEVARRALTGEVAAPVRKSRKKKNAAPA